MDRWDDFLDPGDRLMWTGQPATGLRITPCGIVTSLGDLFLLGFALIARPFVADFHPGRPARNEAWVRFATEVQVDSDGDKTHTRTGFDLIPDGDAVMRLIRQIQTGDIDAGTA